MENMINPYPKIFHITTGVVGGAFLAANRLKNLQNENHLNATLINLADIPDLPNLLEYRIASKLDYELQKSNSISTTSLFSGIPLNRYLLNILEEIPKDSILNLHWMPANLSKKTLRELSDRRVVLTLHDMRYFTGFCHHAGNCRNFENQCQKCPQAIAPMKFLIQHNFTQLLKISDYLQNYQIVCPSKWLYDLAIDSKMFSRASIFQIYNPIPDEIFFPRHKESKKPIKVCIPGSQNRSKGGFKAIELLSKIQLRGKMDLEIYCLGRKYEEFSNLSQTEIENVTSEKKFADFLSGMDLLIHLSQVENSPNLVREAIALGVPVFASDTGGTRELIFNDKLGMVHKNPSDNDLEEFMVRCVLSNPSIVPVKLPLYLTEDYILDQYLTVYNSLL